jgi:hypothetical protein
VTPGAGALTPRLLLNRLHDANTICGMAKEAFPRSRAVTGGVQPIVVGRFGRSHGTPGIRVTWVFTVIGHSDVRRPQGKLPEECFCH